MSDGTSRLYFLDPLALQTSGSIVVLDNRIPVFKINELEYIKDRIFANIWYTDKIAMIDPSTGQVSGWLDLSGLLSAEFAGKVDVLNGIAFDVETDRLFVTGKLWPYLFEIQVIEDIRH
jgi:glutamine cyclotransferase